MTQKTASTLSAGLYLVATPIGNLGDISMRALDTLKAVTTIYCEDTRTSRTLLQHYGITTKCESYHDHSDDRKRESMRNKIEAGEAIALISDAGTPTIADPGFKLVRDLRAANAMVTAIPGASAPLMALSLSGLPSDAFYFGGFLPTKAGAKKEILETVKQLPATLVFLDTPKRLQATLTIAQDILGNRACAVARELTKQFETIYTGSTSHVLEQLHQDPYAEKGECVLLFASANTNNETMSDEEITQALQQLMQPHSPSSAAKILATQTGQPKRHIYNLAMQLKP